MPAICGAWYTLPTTNSDYPGDRASHLAPRAANHARQASPSSIMSRPVAWSDRPSIVKLAHSIDSDDRSDQLHPAVQKRGPDSRLGSRYTAGTRQNSLGVHYGARLDTPRRLPIASPHARRHQDRLAARPTHSAVPRATRSPDIPGWGSDVQVSYSS